MLFRKLREGSAGFLVLWVDPDSGDYRLTTVPRERGRGDGERVYRVPNSAVLNLQDAMRVHPDYAVMSGLEGEDQVIERMAGLDKSASAEPRDPRETEVGHGEG